MNYTDIDPDHAPEYVDQDGAPVEEHDIISEDQAIQAFNDSLDEIYPEVTVAMMTPIPASLALERTDPVAHRVEFSNWASAYLTEVTDEHGDFIGYAFTE